MYKIYTTKYLNAISFICSIIMFIMISLIYKQIINNQPFFPSIFKLGTQDTIKVEFDSIENTITEKKETQNTAETIINEQETITDIEKQSNDIKEQWNLKIPRIFLEASISEGTSADIMNINIGHFEDTSRTFGNIGLAAHNRGYPVNYFENLKLLKKGDLIHYQYNEFIKDYAITENTIIKDTNWEYLQKTEQNVITLITCVENEPQYRRCVRGIELT